MPTLAIRLTALLLLVGAPFVPAVGGAHEDPSGEDCTRLSEDHVLMKANPEFEPGCIRVQNGAQITWLNVDVLSHDPGDTERACFQASNSHLGDGEAPGPGERFTTQLRFDEEADSLENVAVEGADGRPHDCPDHGEPGATWEPVEDEDAIRIPYVCHLHDDNKAVIVLEL